LFTISLLAILTHLALAGRYFDARTGRFLQIDPQAEKYPGVSSYGYALNNPLKYIDPTGEWVAQYDANTRAVMVQAEEGDDLKSLYSQMGMSETKFADYYGFNDMSDFRVVGGETTFDVTGLVTPNIGYDPASGNSNCHSFVCVATGMTSAESGTIPGNELLGTIGNPPSVQQPGMGDVAVFQTVGSVGIQGESVSLNGDPAHSAVFVITNRAGEPQFLNRLDAGSPVTVNTQSQINSHFDMRVGQLRRDNPGGTIPTVERSPIYFRLGTQ